MPAGRVELAPFGPLPAAVQQALNAEIADVQRFYRGTAEVSAA
jgi:hypothetical protein